jgi:hypothetical protein
MFSKNALFDAQVVDRVARAIEPVAFTGYDLDDPEFFPKWKEDTRDKARVAIEAFINDEKVVFMTPERIAALDWLIDHSRLNSSHPELCRTVKYMMAEARGEMTLFGNKK